MSTLKVLLRLLSRLESPSATGVVTVASRAVLAIVVVSTGVSSTWVRGCCSSLLGPP